MQQNNLPICIAVQGETGEPQSSGDSGIQQSGGGSFIVFCPQSARRQLGSR